MRRFICCTIVMIDSVLSGFTTGTAQTAILSPPQNLRAEAGDSSVRLSWAPNPEQDLLLYRIYASEAPNPTKVIDSLFTTVSPEKIITGLANGTTYYFRVTAVGIVLSESNFSKEVSATPIADTTPPNFSIPSFPQPANLNTPAPVFIDATDLSGINGVILYYRVGGDPDFSATAMSLRSNNTYAQSIPASSVTNHGIEFYIQADDVNGNIAYTALHGVRVRCPNGITNLASQPSGRNVSDYRIFSIPLELDNNAPAAFLNANPDLGSPDNTKYRWYAFDRTDGLLREYPDFANISMTPDMGFPLLVNIPNLKLSAGGGTTLDTTVPFEISLPQGWSLIGNPFNFNIPFDSLSVFSGTFELWSFSGDWQINTRGLEAWAGYAVYLSQVATFSIRPGVAGLNNSNSFYSTENNNAANWMIQITAENGRSASRFNFVGQHEQASDEEDVLDLHQPLRLGDLVEVVFSRKNEGTAEQLKADIRQPSESGHVWEFTCLLNPEDEMLSLAFDGVQSIPNSFDGFLIDEDTRTTYDLRSNHRLEFVTRRLAEKHFKLIAGSRSFVESKSPEAELHPKDYALLQNFPNPFNPATQIIYSLPRNSRVEVTVYNIRGEKVATLVNEDQEAGSHTIVWNAAQAGSGIYFIKLEAGGFSTMKKCLLVK